ncbi:ribbon-helix-helix protein, CopG family [Zooshikella ganghwensis]|uniref:ribbon-helix-helix protein, CopG family n=1 Tax=Zooshikella ganghwensis TaxID=202772 RepID=UPI0004263729|nr:ribbon-helix-helix protein, CopG family [Zooshikella ganghwensis]
MKILVDIPDEQVNELAKVCEAENISEAEAIRRAIAGYLEKRSKVKVDAFGLWSKSSENVDGLTYQEQIRDEW